MQTPFYTVRRARVQFNLRRPLFDSEFRGGTLKMRSNSADIVRTEPLLRQGSANQLLVVAQINTAIGKGGMRPDDFPARTAVGGLQQVYPADLLVTFGGQLCD